jgi:hypothetical protein
MATYLQGVTDYIPQFQPFQPDLNFYANALQTKQNQYDTNYKALNNVYGQYFYADLTHGDNLKKKDELIKAIDFNLKRVSGLDLSLQQNVDQAQQVFKPFYEDKHLMKDMAWTKNTNNEKSYAVGLKNNRDEKQRSQYWDAGIKAIDYKTEEFKNASLEDTMKIGNVSYTPYVNVMEKAQKIAKDQGFKIESMSTSADGRWMVKTTNGENILEPLNKLLEAQLGSDPAVIDVYKTQAYVNRKDYAFSNAAQFGGDKNAAEMSYLSESYKVLKGETEANYKKLKNSSDTYDNQISSVQKQITDGNAQPGAETYLERLQKAKGVNDTVLSSTEANHNELKDKVNTASTTSGFENPYGDIESLRYKVDNAMASRLMQKDLGEAANVYAMSHREVDYEANIYAVKAQEHSYRMQEVASANASRERVARMRNASDEKIMFNQQRLASGGYHIDDRPELENGQPNPAYNTVVANDDGIMINNREHRSGTSTPEINMKVKAKDNMKRMTAEYAEPVFKNMAQTLDQLKTQGLISNADITSILGYDKYKNISLSKFKDKLSKNSQGFLNSEIGGKNLDSIYNKFNTWIKDHNGNGAVVDAYEKSGLEKLGTKFTGYSKNLANYDKWKKETSLVVEQEFSRSEDSDVKRYGKYLYDENGRLRSQKEFDALTGVKPGRGNSSVYVEDQKWDKVFREPGNENGNKRMVNPISGTVISQAEPRNKEIYDKLVNKASKVYNTSSKMIKAPPGILGTGAGLTSKENFISVYHNAFNQPGNAFMRETVNDLNNLDLTDDSQVKISYDGTTQKAGAKNKPGGEGAQLVRDYIAEYQNSKGSNKPFELGAVAIAENNSKRGAMIIRPDDEWLKKQVYTLDAKGNRKAGRISESEYNSIVRNGISVIANSNSFNNGLFKASYLDPVQAVVAYDGKYEYVDPLDEENYNKFTIVPDKLGTTDYIAKTQYKVWDPNAKKWEYQGTYDAMISKEEGLANTVEYAENFFKSLRTHNKDQYNVDR